MEKREFKSQFPLPIDTMDRTKPEDYIPDCDDKYGYGQRMWNIFSNLKVTQGVKAGQRFGDPGVAPPWQKKLIISLFGTCDENGIRDYDETLLYCGKKQGKSSFSGPLAVAFVLAYPIQRGNIIILAATLKQSQIIYDSMAATIRADKSLSKLFHVRDYKKDVEHIKTGTKIQAVALEAGNIVGQIVDAFFCDEAHVIGLLGKAKQLIEQLTSGQATIPNPFTLYTTTAPLKKSSGVFSSLYARASRIIQGESPHDRLLPIMFELPEDMDTDDHTQWWRCCPSINYTVPKQWLVEKYNTAKLDPDPTTLQNFYTQHLNKILVDGLGIDKFLPVLIWRNAINKNITLQGILNNSVTLYAGVDLGFRDDPSAILVGGVDKNGIMSVWCEQYLHYDGYEKRKNKVEYDKFIASGELLISHEESFDVECVTNIVVELQNTGKLAGVGVDPVGLESWAQDMEERYPKINIMAIPQGYKMTPSIMQTERFIYGGKLKHQGLPMLEWNIENTSLKKHGEAVALIKPEDIQRSGLKIDGCICLVECVAMASDPEIKPRKVDIAGMIA